MDGIIIMPLTIPLGQTQLTLCAYHDHSTGPLLVDMELYRQGQQSQVLEGSEHCNLSQQDILHNMHKKY